MYNLLVVDDEMIAVKGIVKGIDWSDVPVNEILVAYDVAEAKLRFGECKIHVLLSDIDMPDNNGIELLRWVREHSPETETIFLTGHANFNYAQQAIQLDSYDYLLKPIDHVYLKETIMNSIEKIKKNEELQQFHRAYEHYYQQWNKQLPILSERFWQDIINQRIPMSDEHLVNAYSLYGIPLAVMSNVQVVQISVEQWNESLTARDEEIMTYAVKNAAEEIILKNRPGQVIQDVSGIVYAIVYTTDSDQESELANNCKQFVGQCKQYLRCSISCYIGVPVAVPELSIHIQVLMNIERNHIGSGGSVVLQRNYKKEITNVNYHPSFTDWAVLLEMGKRNELMLRVEESFHLMQGHVDSHYLEGYYHGLVYMVFHVLQRKSITMTEVYPHVQVQYSFELHRSVHKLKEWALPYIDQAVSYLRDHSKDYSSFVQKVIQYIDEHIHEDFNREDLANHVYLNAAYLSRLFKKETGSTLSDYMLEVRMARVKPLLEKTNHKISDIAQSVGYYNFTHFTKMFKKETGLTPQEYRRRFQQVHES